MDTTFCISTINSPQKETKSQKREATLNRGKKQVPLQASVTSTVIARYFMQIKDDAQGDCSRLSTSRPQCWVDAYHCGMVESLEQSHPSTLNRLEPAH
jgi:hypothetical protein